MSYKYIDATDQPSDPNGALGPLRTALRKAYNSSRTPERAEHMKLLRATLAHVISVIDDGSKVEVSETPEPESTEVATPKQAARVTRAKRKPTSKD